MALILAGCTEEEPVADFTADNMNPYLTQQVHFTNESKNAQSYEWDFGDNTSSKEEHPVHSWDDPGVKMVTLRANGSSQVEHQKIITVKEGKAAYKADNESSFSLTLYSFYEENGDLKEEHEVGYLVSGDTSAYYYTNQNELILAFYAYGDLFLIVEPFMIETFQVNTFVIRNDTQVVNVSDLKSGDRKSIEKVLSHER